MSQDDFPVLLMNFSLLFIRLGMLTSGEHRTSDEVSFQLHKADLPQEPLDPGHIFVTVQFQSNAVWP